MHWQRVTAAIFMVLLVVPGVASFVAPDQSLAVIELRSPQSMPGVPRSLSDLYRWTGRFDQFVQDHFPLRSRLIKAHSRFALWMGDSGSPDVVLGEDGWLFFARDSDVLDEHRGIKTLTADEAEQWVREIARRTEWCERQGIDYWVILLPNKHSIYGEHLPGDLAPVGPSLADGLRAALRASEGVHWLDLTGTLQSGARERMVYSRTDTHWNDYGSYLAYREIIRSLQQTRPVHLLEESDLVFKTVQQGGDLARLLNLREELAEDVPESEIPNTAVVHRTGGDYRFEGWYATTSHESACRAVIFCDSFVNRYTQKYLRESFSRSFFIHHRGDGFLRDVIDQEQPDVILFMVAERLIPESLPEADLRLPLTRTEPIAERHTRSGGASGAAD